MKDEFAFIQSITPKRQYQPSLVQGIGDDAALFRHDEMFDMLACVDTMVEDVHFKKSTLKPFHLGYKTLAINLSDIAAMGGLPTYCLVSLAVPKKGWTDAELHELYTGMMTLASDFHVDVIGGDTVFSSNGLIVSVTLLGKVEKDRHLFRSNAKDGDIVFVTGAIGGAAAGLALLLAKGLDYDYNDIEKKLISQHQMPRPQIHAGRLLTKSMCRVSLNDISDGIASEANEIAEASGKTLVLDYDKIPIHEGLAGYTVQEIEQYVLYGGEDYQLIGTIPVSEWDKIKNKFAKASIPVRKVGHVEDGQSAVYLTTQGFSQKLAKKGFNHFRNDE